MKDKKQLDDFMSSITKNYGKGAVLKADSDYKEDLDVISTGSLGLDIATGIGGLPRGRMIEVIGMESSGKTTCLLEAAAQAQKIGLRVLFVDSENALDLEYAANLGVDCNSLFISQPETMEVALNIIQDAVNSALFGLIIVDSVAAMVPKAELEGESGKSLPGIQGRLMSQACRKLVHSVKKNNVCLAWINQMRANIGVMFGPDKIATGGNALRFYASMRFSISGTTKVKGRGEEDEFVGKTTNVRVIKNKCAAPFKTASFDIRYGTGIDYEGEVIDFGVSSGVIEKAGSWYNYGETKLGQGKPSARQILLDNPELTQEIVSKI